MESEIEALRKEREDKVRQIAEKRRQVEELKKRRSERQQQQRQAKLEPGDLNKNVDILVAEILGGDASKTKASPEGPLKELREKSLAAPAEPGERSLHFQQELSVASVAVEPESAESYERSCQTDLQGDQIESGGGGGGGGPSRDLKKQNTSSVLMKMADRARNRVIGGGPASQEARTARRVHGEAAAKEAGTTPEAAKEEVKEMTTDERKQVESQPDFHAFFDRATLIMERALGQDNWDVSLDFKSISQNDQDGDGGSSDVMKYVGDYIEDRWSRGRPVTDLQFSPHQQEMFIAAYHQKVNPELSDPDGCMLVWNLAMTSRPELAFTAPSAVLTARPHRFDPALFYGGTFSGGIVLWDARSKAGPILRTPLINKGHAHPVTAMEQVGTQNATNLVTASQDGRICVWSVAMLNQPQETVDLKNENKARKDPSIMSLSFPENETNVLYVGAEDGSVWQVHILGQKSGITESYEGHEGPVTGIDMHPRQSDGGASADASLDLALSSSFDWSLKLWRVKQYQSPVLSLDTYEDYVYDVRWHPTHPAVFSSVDGEGHVDLWNLNKNMEAPVCRCENPNAKRLALNKCQWSMDGRKLLTGDSEGALSMYTVERSVAQPRNEDFTQFQDRVRQLKPVATRSRDGGVYGDSRFAPSSRTKDH